VLGHGDRGRSSPSQRRKTEGTAPAVYGVNTRHMESRIGNHPAAHAGTAEEMREICQPHWRPTHNTAHTAVFSWQQLADEAQYNSTSTAPATATPPAPTAMTTATNAAPAVSTATVDTNDNTALPPSGRLQRRPPDNPRLAGIRRMDNTLCQSPQRALPTLGRRALRARTATTAAAAHDLDDVFIKHLWT
jgi:hypothetical protein